MAERDDRANADRRDFLKLAGLGSVAGGVALVTGKSVAEAAVIATEDTTGYRETDHVKKAYDLARF